MWRPCAALVLSCIAFAASPRTLRVDLHHMGGPKGEAFALDRLVLEPLPFPGHPGRPLDESNLGKYRFEVRDPMDGRVLYSRGFASILGEWMDTPEARHQNRVFSESLRFPCPEGPVNVVYQRRNAASAFEDAWTVAVDPRAPAVDTAPPPSAGALMPILRNGDPGAKVDLLVLGDGYTARERGKFVRDAKRFGRILFQQEPFKSRRSEFNVWGLCPPAAESGVSRPSSGIHRRNPVGSTYDAFGSERYVLTFDNRAFRDFASQAPYDFVEILVNGRTYGGGGIHQLYGTVASDNAFSPYVFVHEFGHHFAGLADEYYTSDVVLELGKPRQEPWEPNVTADPRHPKWAALLSPGLPLPTPWRKAEFEAFSLGVQKERRQIRAASRPEADMENLFHREREHETRLLGRDVHSGRVGAFEGANYEATGYYRSQEDCIMFTRDEVGFCAACRRAIEAVIAQYAGR